MQQSSLDIDFSKENLLEKDNNLIQPISEIIYSSSPLFLDCQNNKKTEKYINYFYTNSPFSSVNDEIIDQFNLIKPIGKEINNEEGIKKSKDNLKDNNKEKVEYLKNLNEDAQLIMFDKTDDIDLAKLTQITSFGCLNSTSNNDKKNINKKINLFTIKKYEKKRDSILYFSNEEKNNNKNILLNKQIKLNKKDRLQKNEFKELGNNKINFMNFLKKKRRKKEKEEKNENNMNLLLDNDYMKENNFKDFYEIKNKNKLSLKEKFKNLRIKIPKNSNKSTNILPIPQKVQIPFEINSNIINYNSYNSYKNVYYNEFNNNNFNEKEINIQNNSYNKKINNNIYNYDSNVSAIEKGRTKNSNTSQIFESHAPSIIINGIEYTTILIPKKFVEKIKLANI